MARSQWSRRYTALMTVRRVGRKTTPNSPAMKFVVVPIHWSCWIGKMMA